MVREMNEHEGCKGKIHRYESNGTTIVCQEETEERVHNCERIFDLIQDKLENTDEVYIGTKECLTKLFRDEKVEDLLMHKNRLGTTRNMVSYEMGHDVPRQALAITNHKKFRNLLSHEINKEIALTVLHEDSHLGGLGGTDREEKLAEKSARKKL